MADPQSVDEWCALSQQHEAAAKLLCDDRKAAGQAIFHVGLAVEALLKAYIMKKERFNRWPSRHDRRDLYTHVLRDLLAASEITLDASDPLAPSWHTVLQWNRAQGYEPMLTPCSVARSYVDAAFGEHGVAVWLKSQI